MAYNQYGYKRSAASNIVTVGAPTSAPLVLTPRDGDSKVSVSFSTPAVSCVRAVQQAVTGHCHAVRVLSCTARP